MVRETGVDVGRVTMSPEGAAGRFLEAMGRVDLDFESAAFSRQWMVHADDAKVAYELFHPRLVEYLLERDFAVNLAPGHVVCFRDHARDGWEDQLAELWKLLPPRLRG